MNTPRKILVSQFTGPLTALNGMRALTATKADIIRSLVTVGYPSRHVAIAAVGPWRARMLTAMATGYLDDALRTTTYFQYLERTEMAATSFFLGQAFTHWFAQTYMNVAYLVHVAGLSSCSWGTAAAPAAAKAGAATPAPNSRPDFIGIGSGETHVFESKGRVRRPSRSEKAKALGQVSALIDVNGAPPATRCATFFMFKPRGAEGIVIDPDGDDSGSSVTFDVLEAIRRAYAFFLDGPLEPLTDERAQGYVGRAIDDDVVFGIDKMILKAISEQPVKEEAREDRVREIFSILEERSESYLRRRTFDTSVGIDGTLLIARGKEQIAPRRRQR